MGSWGRNLAGPTPISCGTGFDTTVVDAKDEPGRDCKRVRGEGGGGFPEEWSWR